LKQIEAPEGELETVEIGQNAGPIERVSLGGDPSVAE
jgi:hypothetical protein